MPHPKGPPKVYFGPQSKFRADPRSDHELSPPSNSSSSSVRTSNFGQPSIRENSNIHKVPNIMKQNPSSQGHMRAVTQPIGQSQSEEREYDEKSPAWGGVSNEAKTFQTQRPTIKEQPPCLTVVDQAKHATRRCYPQAPTEPHPAQVGNGVNYAIDILDNSTTSKDTDIGSCSGGSRTKEPILHAHRGAIKQSLQHANGRSTASQASNNKNFPKVFAYDEKQAKADERRARGDRYLGPPVDLECIRVLPYDSKAVGQRIDQVFGPSLENTFSIRTHRHVYISQVNVDGAIAVKFSATKPERIRSAISDYKNMLNEARTRAKESSIQVIWDKWESLGQDIVLKAQPDSKRTKGPVKNVKNTVPAVGSWVPHSGYDLTEANLEKLSKALVAAFEEARSFHGVLRLRVSLGTVILERTPRDVVQMCASQFQDHLEEIDEAEDISFSPCLMDQLEQNLLMNLVKAPSSDLLAAKDILIQDPSEFGSLCTYKAKLFLKMPGADRMCHLEVKFTRPSLSETPTVASTRWIQFDTETGTTAEPKCRMRTILACPNEHGLCWKFELSTAKKETRDIPEKWLRNAELIKMKSKSDLENDDELLVLPGPGAWPLKRAQLIREYSFRIHDCVYELDVSHVVDTPYLQGRPALDMRTEYRTVSVSNNQWEALFLENERKKSKRKSAKWMSCLQQFFPEDGYGKAVDPGEDSNDSGLQILLHKLSSIESLITGQYTSSREPVEHSQVTVVPWHSVSDPESEGSDE